MIWRLKDFFEVFWIYILLIWLIVVYVWFMKGEIVLSVKGFVILVFVLKVVKIMGERDSLDRLS